MNQATFPHHDNLARQVPVFPALKARREHQSNIWFFDSPKNDSRLIIHTDLAFMHLVILEGDHSVARYVPRPAPCAFIASGVETEVTVDAHIFRADGLVEWWDFKRMPRARLSKARPDVAESSKSTAAAAAKAAGASYRIASDTDLAGREILFDNWLMLCAAINRCRHHFLGKEVELLMQRLQLQQHVTVEDLLALSETDPAYMLSAIALTLRTGVAQANLNDQLFGPTSTLSRSPS